jgi:hypothetical protein
MNAHESLTCQQYPLSLLGSNKLSLCDASWTFSLNHQLFHLWTPCPVKLSSMFRNSTSIIPDCNIKFPLFEDCVLLSSHAASFGACCRTFWRKRHKCTEWHNLTSHNYAAVKTPQLASVYLTQISSERINLDDTSTYKKQLTYTISGV